MRQIVMEIFKDEIEADKNAAVSATQEEIAKKLIQIKRPFEEIYEATTVPVDRLKELANMLAGTPA